MPRYKVTQPGFYGGIFRTPGGKHDPVVTAAPISAKKLPSWLEEIKEDSSPAKKRGQATQPNEKPADFMGGQDQDNESGLETL